MQSNIIVRTHGCPLPLRPCLCGPSFALFSLASPSVCWQYAAPNGPTSASRALASLPAVLRFR
eukprot:2992866-Pyramimonas_sp.AAC.1